MVPNVDKTKAPRPTVDRSWDWIWLGCLALLALAFVFGRSDKVKRPGHSPKGFAAAQMASLADALGAHRRIRGQLPATLEELTTAPAGGSDPVMESVPKDPWGHAYEYRLDGVTGFTLRSNGEDGQRDTDDDVVYEP
jgi:general secretion pathway protein G